ncbi:hypothetical protein [Naasia lichenicola]|uniref:Uncharacterized protein n=1 Tax=Naasia lichenicola TaxID=2565933 RepID=A0A4S4FJC0_9MICO|nr:hypothetical protein [Naasia lichenicola]THG30004.1 hypothetical protein E6C64_15295 [Naasia lichenicola]
MRIDEVRWNDEARDKIVEDADRVLREAVAELSTSMAGAESDAIFAELIARLKDRFIDFEPGPDIRRYADAIAAGDIEADQSAT